MQSLLVFVAVAALSVLASSRTALRIGPLMPLRQLNASGLSFLLLGALLGPRAAAVFDKSEVVALRPLLALGLGAAGLLIGLNLDPRVLRKLPGRIYAAGFAHAGATLVIVGLPMGLVLDSVTPLPTTAVIAASVLLGAAASVSSGHYAVLWHRMGRMDRSLGLGLGMLSMLDDLVALAVLAIALAVGVFAGAEAEVARGPALVGLALGLGAFCGALLALLLSGTSDARERVAIMLGGVALVGGAAAYLRVSALLSGVACGGVLAIIGGRSVERGYQALARVERPTFLLLVFLIGLHVDATSLVVWGLVGAFVVLRLLGKVAGGAVAGRLARGALVMPPRPGYALLAQGAVALCLAVEYLGLAPGDEARLLFDVTAIGAMVNELLAANLFGYSLRPGRALGPGAQA